MCDDLFIHASASASLLSPLSFMQVCKGEDFLKLGEEDVREMLRDEEVTPPPLLLLSSRMKTPATFSLAMCPRCAVCSERREACAGGGDKVDEGRRG